MPTIEGPWVWVQRPEPPLSRMVEEVWLLDGDFGSGIDLLPKPVVEIGFSLGPRVGFVQPGSSGRAMQFFRAWVAGIQQTRIRFAPGRVKCAGLRFRPGCARSFLGVPLAEITDQVLDLDLFIGNAAEQLRDRLVSTHHPLGKLKLLEEWIGGWLHGFEAPIAAMSGSLALIRRAAGQLRIPDLAREVGISHSHLIRRFRYDVGVSPKRLARIVRLHAALGLLRSRNLSLAQIAHEAGFADQAHFTREFRAFCGTTPGSWDCLSQTR